MMCANIFASGSQFSRLAAWIPKRWYGLPESLGMHAVHLRCLDTMRADRSSSSIACLPASVRNQYVRLSHVSKSTVTLPVPLGPDQYSTTMQGLFISRQALHQALYCLVFSAVQNPSSGVGVLVEFISPYPLTIRVLR